MKHKIAEILKVGGGAIINKTSILGQVGLAGVSAYVAAKHVVIGFISTIEIKYAANGIRVNSILPAFIRTSAMLTSLEENAEVLNGLVALHPIGNLGRIEEVAELVTWLRSNHASFDTGVFFAVDRGYLAR